MPVVSRPQTDLRIIPALLLSCLAFGVHADKIPELDTIYAVGDQDDFESRRTASSTKLIYGREELDRMNELTIGDYLRRLPGVTFTGPPGNPKDVRVRGMDKGYTQFLINGEPVPGGTKERQLQVDRIPLDLIERIELIRAPSADMPNEGMMGSINIVLRDAPSARVSSARLVTGRLFGEATDRDSWNLSGQYGDAHGDLRWLLNLSVGERADLKFKTKDETAFANNPANAPNARNLETEDERARTRTFDLAPRLNYRLSASDELILSPWYTRSDETKSKTKERSRYVGAPFTDPSTVVGNGRESHDEEKVRETARIRAEWNRKLDNGQFSLFAATQEGSERKDTRKLTYNASGALTKVALEDDHKRERDWYLGSRWEQRLGNHRVSLGLEYRDKSRRDEKSVLEGNSWATLAPKTSGRGDHFDITERSWTAFIQDEITLSKGHVLTPGVRLSQTRQQAADSSGVTSSATVRSTDPSLHYLWQIDQRNNLRASLTRTLKPGKFDDLSTVTDTQDGTTVKPDKSGNAALKPESAVGVELGFDHFLADSTGVIGVNAFHRNIRDMVERRTLLENNGRYVERPYNVGNARVWGWELDARPHMGFVGLPELMLRFNYTRLYSSIRDNQTGQRTRIKDQPPYVYNVGFDWQLSRWDAAWGMNYNFTPKYLKNPTEPLKADDEARQRLLDMYVMKRLSRDLSLRITASNLLDMEKEKYKRHYRDDGRRDKFTRENESGGRSLFVALEGKW